MLFAERAQRVGEGASLLGLLRARSGAALEVLGFAGRTALYSMATHCLEARVALAKCVVQWLPRQPKETWLARGHCSQVALASWQFQPGRRAYADSTAVVGHVGTRPTDMFGEGRRAGAWR